MGVQELLDHKDYVVIPVMLGLLDPKDQEVHLVE